MNTEKLIITWYCIDFTKTNPDLLFRYRYVEIYIEVRTVSKVSFQIFGSK